MSQINAKKSGGETTTPFYVAMALLLRRLTASTNRAHQTPSRLALFDEAFSKMDTARTASALQFMREAGLQVLLATPPDKSGSLLPFVDTVCTVVRNNSHALWWRSIRANCWQRSNSRLWHRRAGRRVLELSFTLRKTCGGAECAA